MKLKVSYLKISMLFLILTGCQGNSAGTNVGTVLGTALGAYGGQALGKKLGSDGQIIGGILGAGLGALIGNQIGQYLDPEEKKQASIATTNALNSNGIGTSSTQTWTSPTNPGTSGGTTVTQQTKNPDGRICKVANSFANVKGQDVKVSETYCRNPQTGTWALEA